MGSDSSGESKVVVVAALAANFVIAVAKFAAAVASGSSALFSEGVHSVADTGNEALLLLGLHRSRKPPDEGHPFGHGPELYFWSLIVAIVLFSVGGGLSIYEGVHALLSGGEPGDPTWNYVVLAVAFVSEGISWAVALAHFRERYAGRPFLQAFHHSKDPSLFMPLAEDTAALAGLLVAFAGVFLSHRLHQPAYDGAASILIGLILCAVALFLVYETKALLVGEATDDRLEEAVREAALADPDVDAVNRLLTMHLSPNEILLNLGVRFHDAGSATDVARAMNRIERRIRDRDTRISRIFIEPEAPDEGGRSPPI